MVIIIRLYYLSIRSRGESMGNLGGTSKKVPHPANPLHIGIPSDLNLELKLELVL